MAQPKSKVNKPATIKKAYRFAAMAARIATETTEPIAVTVSGGNTKIGDTMNVSIPPIYTCPGCCGQCSKYCYAVTKYLRLGADMDNPLSNAWNRNLAAYISDPVKYFSDISKRHISRGSSGGMCPGRL